ncbi:MAG: methanogenesis marker 3 protein [Methanomassiliicoccales archaeon]|nr:methanogenesis marker 3 protein [Methanomassiliicoccales archaeon]MDD1756771.1 methanogenesis marker 3 protein [Methanomassiliicoccales archaeon]
MNRCQMKINVNGAAVEAKSPAVLSEVIKGHPHQPGSLLAIIRPSESVKKETDEFDLITPRGPLGLRLNDSKYAALFRELVGEIKGKGVRWQTSKVTAIGSFPTQIEVSRDSVRYGKFDCFFALGGFDSKSSYIMISRLGHDGAYGTAGAIFGKITRGRHVLSELREGESILDIVPVIEEVTEKSAMVTNDLDTVLEEGMSVESFVGVKLERECPVNSEHFLVLTEKGTLPITEVTESYSACSKNLDVSLIAEKSAIREPGVVTVRHEGSGMGRVYFYKTRRQISNFHTRIGQVTSGFELLKLAPAKSLLTVVTDPPRVMVIGMTQAMGAKVLGSFGLKQVRKGDLEDDAIIVEQEPELTMQALHEPEVETLGVRPEKVNDITIDEDKAVQTARYIRKMTGLSHKPIGTLKVHFTFEDMPMVTFDGNYSEAGHLVPENEFKGTVLRGELGVTNMSRPNRGLIGIRLQASEEFGPTGEEPYGTNLAGKVVSDLDALMRDLKDGDIIYLREVKAAAPAKKAKRKAAAVTVAKPKPARPKQPKPKRSSKEEDKNG